MRDKRYWMIMLKVVLITTMTVLGFMKQFGFDTGESLIDNLFKSVAETSLKEHNGLSL